MSFKARSSPRVGSRSPPSTSSLSPRSASTIKDVVTHVASSSRYNLRAGVMWSWWKDVRLRTLVLVNIAAIVERADEALLPAVYNEVGQAFHASPQALGTLTLVRALVQVGSWGRAGGGVGGGVGKRGSAVTGALTCPLAPWLAHWMARVKVISVGAFTWAIATLGVGVATNYYEVAAWRGLNGVGLALVIPAIQSLVADSASNSTRGMAFGWLQFVTNFGNILGFTLGISLACYTFFGLAGWRMAFIIVTVVSLGLAAVLWLFAHDPPPTTVKSVDALAALADEPGAQEERTVEPLLSEDHSLHLKQQQQHHQHQQEQVQQQQQSQVNESTPLHSTSHHRISASSPSHSPHSHPHPSPLPPTPLSSHPSSTFLSDVLKVLRIRTFQLIIAQGVVGSFPWAAGAFFPMWFELLGFSHASTAVLLSVFTVACSLGGLFGGWFGDVMARRWPDGGRLVCAQISAGSAVVLSTVLLRVVPHSPDYFGVYIMVLTLMGFLISWNAAGTNNPIFAEIVPERLRTDIYALDRTFEMSIAAFAPPTVGYLAQACFQHKVIQYTLALSIIKSIRYGGLVVPDTDLDVLRERYRFIRSEADDAEGTWEQRLAKRYYDKLFKEDSNSFSSSSHSQSDTSGSGDRSNSSDFSDTSGSKRGAAESDSDEGNNAKRHKRGRSERARKKECTGREERHDAREKEEAKLRKEKQEHECGKRGGSTAGGAGRISRESGAGGACEGTEARMDGGVRGAAGIGKSAGSGLFALSLQSLTMSTSASAFKSRREFRFCIDRGGTFTDIYAEVPGDPPFRVVKLLSEDPLNYDDAPREGIRRILEEVTGEKIPRNAPLPTERIDWIRMGTTVATNALLERAGERTALCVTPGKRTVRGVSGELVRVLVPLNIEKTRAALEKVLARGIKSLAIAFLHSYTFPDHERAVAALAREMGFNQVSASSDLVPMRGFDSGLADVAVSFMRSDGGLTPAQAFTGYQAILSGPAGGVVGFARTTFEFEVREMEGLEGLLSDVSSSKENNQNDKEKTKDDSIGAGTAAEGVLRCRPVIGFDMGGTSTDVSRYAGGAYEQVLETTTAGITIQAPQLDINTVAAGGGSRLFFESGMLRVGPASVGAHPGPVCYRKGGQLAVTDANLLLGRVLPEYFPAIFGPNEDLPLDEQAAREAMAELAKEVNRGMGGEGGERDKEGEGGEESGQDRMSVEEVAMGFIRVANEAMCRPIRELTEARGHETSSHVLACFGGAGPQHACAIARSLGISTVFVHRLCGILSAYGMGLADRVVEMQEPAAERRLTSWGRFKRRFEREFGFDLQGDRRVLIDDIRVKGVAPSGVLQQTAIPRAGASEEVAGGLVAAGTAEAEAVQHRVYFEGGWRDTAVFRLEKLRWGHVVAGPAVILNETSTVVVEPGCTAGITKYGNIVIAVSHTAHQSDVEGAAEAAAASAAGAGAGAVAAAAAAAGGGAAAAPPINTSHPSFPRSPLGRVANAPHVPVHLGAMSDTVRWQLEYWGRGAGVAEGGLQEGDVLVTNHPCAGGSHLPDITVVTPVFREGRGDSSGAAGGAGVGRGDGRWSRFEWDGQGGGKTVRRVPGTRRIEDNLSDLRAQVAANQRGIELIGELVEECGLETVLAYMGYVQVNAEQVVRRMLTRTALKHLESQNQASQEQQQASHEQQQSSQEASQDQQGAADNALPTKVDAGRDADADADGKQVVVLQGEDRMDDGSLIRLRISIHPASGSAHFDFTGTSPEVYGNWNAPTAVTTAAIIYCLRCLVDSDIPLNQGCLAPVRITLPLHSLLSPSDAAAVVGGNVLTSQRVTDIILSTFAAAANSQGCMNNLTFGDGTFGYYETIAAGWGRGRHGREKTGGVAGVGERRGGHGVEREVEFLRPATVSMLSERRVLAPNGGVGGGCGARGVESAADRAGREGGEFGGEGECGGGEGGYVAGVYTRGRRVGGGWCRGVCA
ncbi:unnamed protein product [Closterium sp. NIES-64]|nr:unnamed protein product [Closterium sp. NIES-64]